MIDAMKLQRRLGVPADGDIGPATMTALFVRMGATAEVGAELGMAAAVRFAAAGLLDSALRLAHVMAQLAHESGGFRYMEEIASGRAYEGRKDLGNSVPGDGVRYKGRGPIQVTGRANYRTFGRALGIDLERHPELAEIPSIGLAVSVAYWTARGINAAADRDDLVAVTRAINGGTNGLDDRRARLVAAKALVS